MLQFDRILLPTDFSTTARRALSFAAHLADRHGATLHFLHVQTPDEKRTQPPGVESPTTEDELAECVRRAAEGLGDPTATDGHQGVSMVQDRIVAKSVPEAVVEYAEAHDVDLIVMGTARRSGLRTLFPQSTASAVVRHAPCPVLTVLDEPEIVPGPIHRIFVGYDFSGPAREAVRYGEALADLYGADLSLVHVVRELMVPMEYEVEMPDVDVKAVKARAKMALEDVSTHEHNVLVSTGHPARRLVELAEDHDADLLVIATHGRTGLRRVLLGSVAEQVIRQASCPVFAVKAFGTEGEADAAQGEMESTR
jgi:nucleotide-binding universal stress UspA family protein